MKDRLKSYIDANRDAFDGELPDPAVWDTISKGIAMNQTAPVRTLRRVRWGLAAAVAVIALVGVTLFYHREGPAVAPMTAEVDSTALYNEELYHFSRIIDIKFREVEKIKGDHPELYARFSSDLQKLDTAYQQLKQQLQGPANQEMVLQAMLQDLTLQVNLINQQLGIIQQLKNDSHAKATSHL